MKIDFIKSMICSIDNIPLEEFDNNIKSFEKLMKSTIKKYEDIFGLEDYKMRKEDFTILLYLYKNTNYIDNKLNILLYYIYSYYKLDGISFNRRKFPFKSFFTFISNNENIHELMLDQF